MSTGDKETGQQRNIDAFVDRIRSGQQERYAVEELFEGIRAGDKAALSRGITLVESRKAEDIAAAHDLLQRCLRHNAENREAERSTQRIAITGTPGVGKSTFINTYARIMAQKGCKVAILTVDPSSYLSHGSILGDKTRMDDLAGLREVYIRPSASGDTLGGVHSRTREAILLCETAGFDHLVVETVGVGQSEFAVQRMTDVLVLLLLPGSGDELQGIKKGIMEVADILLINKQDAFGDTAVGQTISDYRRALHLSAGAEEDWTTRVLPCSALNAASVTEVREVLEEYFRHARLSGRFSGKRQQQWKDWFNESLGWAVQEVMRERGLEIRDHYPGPQELPPASALALIRDRL